MLGRPLKSLCTHVFQKDNLVIKHAVGLSMLKTAALRERRRGMRAWQDLTTAVNQYTANFTGKDHFEEQQTTESFTAVI